MKLLLSPFLFTLVFYLTIVNGLNPPSSARKEEIVKKITEYKLENALECRPGYKLGYFDYTNSFPFLYQGDAAALSLTEAAAVQFNTMPIPDTLSGTTFNLRIHDTAKQFFPGAITTTSAFNNNAMLGPTLIF